MKNKTKFYSSSPGFTVVEMLATIAIIAILVSLLLPAFSMVRKAADKLKQKSQFNSIEIALESFRQDHGDYPKSLWTAPANNYGAQSLAEAMVGQDGFGFHPDSEFRQDGLADYDGDSVYTDVLYDTATTGSRLGPYLELETANAVKVSSVYESIISVIPDTYILADSFGLVKHLQTQKSTGMPILYFKADTSQVEHSAAAAIGLGDDTNTYTYNDNRAFFNTAPPWYSGTFIPAGPAKFYNATLNPNFTSPPRPYNADSFILLSAGPDGLYGTSDDVYNFDTD